MTDIIETQPILVEFVGAAGVGKSFLAAKIYDELDRRNVSVMNFQLIPIRTNSVRNLLIVMRAAVITFLLNPKTLTLCMRSLKRLARYEIRRHSCESDHDIYICDEGIFQMLRSLHRNSRSHGMPEIADQLFKFVDLPDIVVVV